MTTVLICVFQNEICLNLFTLKEFLKFRTLNRSTNETVLRALNHPDRVYQFEHTIYKKTRTMLNSKKSWSLIITFVETIMLYIDRIVIALFGMWVGTVLAIIYRLTNIYIAIEIFGLFMSRGIFETSSVENNIYLFLTNMRAFIWNACSHIEIDNIVRSIETPIVFLDRTRGLSDLHQKIYDRYFSMHHSNDWKLFQ